MCDNLKGQSGKVREAERIRSRMKVSVIGMGAVGAETVRSLLNMAEIKIWILIAVVSTLAAILGFGIKVVTHEVLKRLDAIVNELKQLTRETTVQQQQIKRLQDQDTTINYRLNDHARRIRTLELMHKEEKPVNQ